MNKKSTLSVLTGIVVALAVTGLAFGIPPQEAAASHSGEPTMWVNGINKGQTHSYIYTVPSSGLDMSVALMIKDMAEKPNVVLSATNPLGATTICPISTVTTAGVPTSLLVSECFFSPPVPGIWTFSITAMAVTSNPVGYAIAADTTAYVIP